MYAAFVQLFNQDAHQVLLGLTQESLHAQAIQWFRSKGVDIPEEISFLDWYPDAPLFVLYWDSDQPVEPPEEGVIIRWSWQNIRAIRPDWNEERCRAALIEVVNQLGGRSVEIGWNVLYDAIEQFEDQEENMKLAERLRAWEGGAIEIVASDVDVGWQPPEERLEAAIHELLDHREDAASHAHVDQLQELNDLIDQLEQLKGQNDAA